MILPVALISLFLLPVVLTEAKAFLIEFPNYTTRLLDGVERWAVKVGMSLEYNRSDVLTVVQSQIEKMSAGILKLFTDWLKHSVGDVTQAILTILNIFLIPIFFFYFVSEKNYWISTIKAIIPREHHKLALETLDKSGHIFKSYLQGQVLACTILAIFYSVGLAAVGLKFGILIGIVTGALTFVPYVGFSIGLVMGLIVASTMGSGIGHVLIVFIVFMIGQSLETFVITPKYVGKNVGLTELESILVLIIFGNFFGFIGMLVAIPSGAIIKTALTNYVASK
jgi:predicted PurR-regulated permease PerM